MLTKTCVCVSVCPSMCLFILSQPTDQQEPEPMQSVHFPCRERCGREPCSHTREAHTCAHHCEPCSHTREARTPAPTTVRPAATHGKCTPAPTTVSPAAARGKRTPLRPLLQALQPHVGSAHPCTHHEEPWASPRASVKLPRLRDACGAAGPLRSQAAL